MRVSWELKQIFFDLDGPIIDVAPKFYRLYTDLFKARGHAVLSKDEYWSLKRNKIPEAQIALRTAPADFVQNYVPERIRVIENIDYLQHDTLIDGALPLLTNLSSRFKLILVTLRNRRENLMWELRHFDLEKYFTVILTKEDNHGDHNTKIELISQFRKAGEGKSMIVGDTESDVKAGQALGLKTVAVTCGIRTKEYLLTLSPDYIIDSMTQLSDIVDRELAE